MTWVDTCYMLGSMNSQSFKNLFVSVVVLIVLFVVSSYHEIQTSHASVEYQWLNLEKAFDVQLQVMSRLSQLLGHDRLLAFDPNYKDPRKAYSRLSDHESQILFISEQLDWLERLFSDPKIGSYLKEKTSFYTVVKNSVLPQLVLESIDYNSQVSFFNERLKKFRFRYFVNILDYHMSPFLSIGTDRSLL